MEQIEPLVQRVEAAFRNHDWPRKGCRILVMCSGGLDSVCLAHALRLMRIPIGLLHVNYQLRGPDSAADADFVTHFAAQWGLPIHLHTCPAGWESLAPQAENEETPWNRRDSLQTRARKIRYRFAQRIAQQQGYTHIATAHTADDNLETVLISLLRGTRGGPVLKSIPAHRDNIIRPFLGVQRVHIHEFALANGVVWREDASNQSDSYLRNRIRNHLVPALAMVQPNYREAILEKARYADYQDRALRSSSYEWAAQFIVVQGDNRFKVFRSSLYTPYAYTHLYNWVTTQKFPPEIVDTLLALKKYPLYKRRWIKGHWLEATEDWIHVWQGSESAYKSPVDAIAPLSIDVDTVSEGSPLAVAFGPWTISLQVVPLHMLVPLADSDSSIRPEAVIYTYLNRTREHSGVQYLDPEALALTEGKRIIRVRVWQPGDHIRPLGNGGTTKIKKVLQVPKHLRNQAFVCCDAGGLVLWAEGRIADRVKITPITRRVLRVEVTREGIVPTA